jgi:uncharacterized protein (DUF2132 family)
LRVVYKKGEEIYSKDIISMLLNFMNNNSNPLHGITLEKILLELVDFYGFEELSQIIDINCFKIDPSIKSSLNFLRRTPWARTKVENLYMSYLREKSPSNSP